jgi:hypothetical protein
MVHVLVANEHKNGKKKRKRKASRILHSAPGLDITCTIMVSVGVRIRYCSSLNKIK